MVIGDTLRSIFTKKAVNVVLAASLFAGTAGLLTYEIYDGRLGEDIAGAAARHGQTWVLSTMDALGVDLDRSTDALVRDAASSGYRQTVQWLLDSLESRPGLQGEALISAAQEGHVDVVSYLLDRGADIHTRMDGALFAAAANNHNDVVKALLARGADPQAISNVTPRCRMVENVSSEEVRATLGFEGCKP